MFDRYIVVDWSANATPKLGRDSIWIAVHDRTGQVSVTNVATRRSAEAFLIAVFDADPALTTLVGVDFSLGYPAGTAAALGLSGTPWSAMWAMLADRICDDDRNSNNRFVVAAGLNEQLTGAASPFWGCPRSVAGEHLATTKPSTTHGLAPFRRVEEALRAQGRRPFSSWQLLGAGAVGSQSLVGIPVLDRLRHRYGDRLEVWPFTTRLEPPLTAAGVITVAEVWPSMHEFDEIDGVVRDAAQVTATARWLAASDSAGTLRALFSPPLSSGAAASAVTEEGWVLGVMP
jgi:precorrin-8X/cobalt-precorrin-8 methylmutase